MRSSRARTRGDDGFSLTELIVSLALLGVVLALAYAIFQVVSMGQRNADREAQLAQNITYPLTRLSEIIVQNSRIEASPAPTGFFLAVRTDQNLDDIQEQHVFTLVATGGDTYVEHQSFTMDAAGARVLPARFVHRWGTRVTNAQVGVPLFTYLDASGHPITDMARVVMDARAVRVTIHATVDGRNVSDSVLVAFRNRQ